MDGGTTSKPQAIASFATLAGHLEQGALNHDLSRHMQEVVKTLIENRQKGVRGKATLTLKIDFTITAQGHMQIAPDITLKLPKMPRSGAIMWPTQDGKLAVGDPDQPEIPFRTVEGGSPAARAVEAEPEVKTVG